MLRIEFGMYKISSRANEQVRIIKTVAGFSQIPHGQALIPVA